MLEEAHRRSSGSFGVPGLELREAKEWLLASEDWGDERAHVNVLCPETGAEKSSLKATFFTRSWVLRAVLAPFELRSDPRVIELAGEILASRSGALWKRRGASPEAWATHDALDALRRYGGFGM